MARKSPAGTRASRPVPRKRKGAYHHGNLRQVLIDAALALVENGGAAALSLREAARRAGVSTAAPYRHFSSRKALLAAVAEEGFGLLGEEIRRAIAAHHNPARRLGEAGIAYVLFAAANPSHFKVMFSSALADRRAYPALEAAADGASRLLLAAIRDYQKAGWMSSGDPREMQLSAWSIVHGLASLITSGHVRVADSDPARIEEIARTVVRSLVPGFDG